MAIMKRVPFWSFKHIAKNAIKVLQQPLSKVLTQTQIGNREKDMTSWKRDCRTVTMWRLCGPHINGKGGGEGGYIYIALHGNVSI